MATHSSILAWKIPWTEKPGRLQSMGSQSQTRLTSLSLSGNKITHAAIGILMMHLKFLRASRKVCNPVCHKEDGLKPNNINLKILPPKKNLKKKGQKLKQLYF